MKVFIPLLLLLLSPFANASSDHLLNFVVGKYLLVGKALDSDQTYSGKIEISRKGDQLVVQRQIAKAATKGTGSIETAMQGEAKILRIRFTEDSQKYEETCLIKPDLDNYARISCHLYKPGVKTNKPGLEALFYDHSVD